MLDHGFSSLTLKPSDFEAHLKKKNVRIKSKWSLECVHTLPKLNSSKRPIQMKFMLVFQYFFSLASLHCRHWMFQIPNIVLTSCGRENFFFSFSPLTFLWYWICHRIGSSFVYFAPLLRQPTVNACVIRNTMFSKVISQPEIHVKCLSFSLFISRTERRKKSIEQKCKKKKEKKSYSHKSLGKRTTYTQCVLHILWKHQQWINSSSSSYFFLPSMEQYYFLLRCHKTSFENIIWRTNNNIKLCKYP